MPVSRCVCFNVSFDTLRDIASRDRLTFPRLRERTRCGSGCGMCEPYIRVMLATGQTRFRVMAPATANRILAEARRDDALDQPMTVSPPDAPDAPMYGRETTAISSQ